MDLSSTVNSYLAYPGSVTYGHGNDSSFSNVETPAKCDPDTACYALRFSSGPGRRCAAFLQLGISGIGHH